MCVAPNKDDICYFAVPFAQLLDFYLRAFSVASSAQSLLACLCLGQT